MNSFYGFCVGFGTLCDNHRVVGSGGAGGAIALTAMFIDMKKKQEWMWIHSKIARMHKHYQAIDQALPSNRPSSTKQ